MGPGFSRALRGGWRVGLVEVLRRTSNNYGVVQRVGRLTRHLDRQGRVQDPTPRPRYQPHKLSQRLSDDTITAVLAAYLAGSPTREVSKRFGIAHSSVNKLLRQHGITARRGSLSPAGLQQAVELYETGLSIRVIANHLGFGASTVARALVKAGIHIRPRFSTGAVNQTGPHRVTLTASDSAAVGCRQDGPQPTGRLPIGRAPRHMLRMTSRSATFH
jgi:transposase-like protein